MKFRKALIAALIVSASAGLAMTQPALAKGNNRQPAVSVQALSSVETETLKFMREEEKLARDVYITLYYQWKLPVFNNISGSEQQHTDRVKMLLQTYGVADPVVDDSVGVFANATLGGLYTQLVTQGQKSVLDALYVGAFIEETDIADLQKAISDTTHPDIANVYSNLMQGSRNHLRAFVGQIESLGVNYVAQALPQAEVDAIVDSPRERGGAGGGAGRGKGGR
ncbi:MAG: DUF2202 domain-containing protein [Gammaproteobacteria bacterium]|nr:DUF2202 domain-containing protein [Gammaproteobacteria bacterium]MBU1722427.1 DUF2202 domain-containing protein [Gammaproteobacteria bacterium]MBU2004636.1 DUF2202 domain-containing protein [Gammaproteobacteria bacterium]